MIAAGLVAKKALEKGLKYLFLYLESKITLKHHYLQDQELLLDILINQDLPNILMILDSQLLVMDA